MEEEQAELFLRAEERALHSEKLSQEQKKVLENGVGTASIPCSSSPAPSTPAPPPARPTPEKIDRVSPVKRIKTSQEEADRIAEWNEIRRREEEQCEMFLRYKLDQNQTLKVGILDTNFYRQEERKIESASNSTTSMSPPPPPPPLPREDPPPPKRPPPPSEEEEKLPPPPLPTSTQISPPLAAKPKFVMGEGGRDSPQKKADQEAAKLKEWEEMKRYENHRSLDTYRFPAKARDPCFVSPCLEWKRNNKRCLCVRRNVRCTRTSRG